MDVRALAFLRRDGRAVGLGARARRGSRAPRLEKLSVKPNPAGLQIGFWPNYRRMPEVLKDFGLRPTERVDCTNWASVETKPGVYDWSKCFNNSLLAHLCGSAVINNINVSFSKEINPKGKHAIPEFYPPRITNPETPALRQEYRDQNLIIKAFINPRFMPNSRLSPYKHQS